MIVNQNGKKLKHFNGQTVTGDLLCKRQGDCSSSIAYRVTCKARATRSMFMLMLVLTLLSVLICGNIIALEMMVVRDGCGRWM